MTTTFDERYASAKSTIDAHNAVVERRGRGTKMSWDAFDDNLIDGGYTTVLTLKRLTAEKIMSWSVPEALAHALIEILNPDASTTPTAPSSSSSAPVVHTTAASPPHGAHVRFENPPPPAAPSIFGQNVTVMTRAEQVAELPIAQIVDNYDPRNPDNVFGMALVGKVRIARCVVFNADGTVNRAATAKLVEEIVAKKPERKTWTDATGDIHPVYQIGVLPVGDDMVKICPVHRCELRDDDECTGHDESWAGVPEVILYLFAIGIETREATVMTVTGNKLELQRVIGYFQGKAEEEAIKIFGHNISKGLIVDYKNRKATGQALPPLRVPRSQLGSAVGGAPGRPFGGSGGSILPLGGSVSVANGPNGPIDLSKGLTGPSVKALSDALLSAFPDANALESVTFYGMDVRLNAIVTDTAAYQYVPGQVVAWAISQGRLIELINAASQTNPGNPDLKAFVARCKAGEPRVWDRKTITKFRKALEVLYPDGRSARALVGDTSIDKGRCLFDKDATTVWSSILDEAERSPQGTLDELLAAVNEDRPGGLAGQGF